MSSAIPIRKQNTRGSAIFAGSTWETKWLRIYGYESSSKTRRKKLALRNCCFVVHCTSVYALILVARLSTDVFRACLASFGLVRNWLQLAAGLHRICRRPGYGARGRGNET